MSTMLSSGFSNLMAPGLARVISTDYQTYDPEYSKVFKVQSSTRQFEEGLTIEGLPAPTEKNEGNATTYQSLTEGYKTTFTHKSYSIGARVTKEAYDDDLYKVFKNKLGQFMSRAVRQRQEILGADILNNGFATAGADGVSLLNTAHPFASGGTWTNRLAADADLSVTSLQDLSTIMETTEEAHDIVIQLKPKLLIVPAQERFNASIILESALKPGTANNDKNAIQDLDLRYIVMHFLTDTDAFFLQGDRHGLIYYEREKPIFYNFDDQDTLDAKFQVFMRASAGWDDPRGLCGSQGA